MKKLISLFAILAMVFSMQSCINSGDTPDATQTIALKGYNHIHEPAKVDAPLRNKAEKYEKDINHSQITMTLKATGAIESDGEEISLVFNNIALKYDQTNGGFSFSLPEATPVASDGNNYKVFRYADAVLMAAECYCALLDKDKAMEYLNKVKRRAGIAEYTRFRTYPLRLNEIQNERGRELLGEFQRKFDMVRWGIWYERTAALSDYAKVKTSIQPCHEYYPIPDTEVIYSGGALDNNEYKKYGF